VSPLLALAAPGLIVNLEHVAEENILGARKKLNEVNVFGSLGAAGILGILTSSWMVFVVAGAILVAAGVYSGDIRSGKGKRR
jgi:hypothetical protein